MKTWNDARRELFTPEEITESDKRVSKLVSLIDARNDGRITQKQMEEIIDAKSPSRYIIP